MRRFSIPSSILSEIFIYLNWLTYLEAMQENKRARFISVHSVQRWNLARKGSDLGLPCPSQIS